MVDNPEDTVWLMGCDFDKECELLGSGWNYDFVETWRENVEKGIKFNWEGPIGNREVTKH
jgi:hypothetical protein